MEEVNIQEDALEVGGEKDQGHQENFLPLFFEINQNPAYPEYKDLGKKSQFDLSSTSNISEDSYTHTNMETQLDYFNTTGQYSEGAPKLESEVFIDFSDNKSWQGDFLEEPSVQCDLCNYKPNKPSKKTIRVHKEAIHLGVKHSCPHCEKTWTTRSNLLKHVANAHSGRSLSCAECSFTTSSRDQLKSHNERIHVKTEHICKIESCGYIARSSANLNLHHLSSHVEKKFYCLVCFERFATLVFLKPHIRQHHDGLFCDTCYYQPKTETDLIEHNAAKHGGVFYPCEKCHRPCRSKLHLQWHIQAAHSKRNIPNRQEKNISFVCDLCGYKPKVASLFALKVHKEAVHEGIRYNCPHCQHPCTTRSNLKRHIETKHDKQRQYSCDNCSYTAQNELHLKQHKDEVHLGIFLDPTQLIIHETDGKKRTQKNRRLTSCNKSFGTACNFVCKSKGILAEHYKTTHENPAQFCVQCGFRTDSQIEMDNHKLEHELKKKNMETLDPGDETVSAVDSLVTYAVEQVRAFVIFILLEKSKKM